MVGRRCDMDHKLQELLDQKGEVNLFTRPRRFGKTLNMSMFQYFFEDARDRNGNIIDHRYLFDGLHIMQAGEKYLSHMGQYPVINLSLKSGKQPDFEMAYTMMRRQIAAEYARHAFILQHQNLSEQKKRYLTIMRETAGRSEYNDSLQFLSQCLQAYYGRKAIILIDEYDVPLENAFIRGFYDKMIDFIRTLFESALKTNSSLAFAVITGCLRISKESIFTGLNNLKIISTLIEGKTLIKPIHEDITYDEVYQTMDNLWNFMFFTGYFRRKIFSWFEEKVKEKDRTRLFQAVAECDAETMEEEITQMLLETISFNDAYESFYHGFLAGIFPV